MAGEMKVNTDNVALAAATISGINGKIANAFSDVEASMNSLNTFWDGSASDNSRSAFFSIKENYCDDRYNVLDSYVKFLNQTIGIGYDQTEDINKKLADLFK